MNVLVLGGTRFVELFLVELLHRQGDSATVLNRRRTQARLPGEVSRIRASHEGLSQLHTAM